ncbi:regulator SirB [Alkalilimnicola ehrlichii]|uniref:Regulator SirB n=1 Tax=Alkalilimnicola ehrlichii TaxID=351052 RepID=A0A3E0X408_9GAMM|nr:SirB2 family protein [Alkalilimnicola ehrlichii]RFA31134.1 regulator SirB [Alkalilimnicola ehrlichii]RFA39580.1 regulator SirB [Alkalilimnicola ehrlichii]
MFEYYGLIKHLHMSTAVLTLAFFIVRGSWMFFSPERLQQRWVKIVPHVIDTVLLLSALSLVAIVSMPHSWLGAKVLGLLVYIGLGMIALKRGKTQKIRIAAFIGALLAFGYILAVAFTKQPWPFG